MRGSKGFLSSVKEEGKREKMRISLPPLGILETFPPQRSPWQVGIAGQPLMAMGSA